MKTQYFRRRICMAFENSPPLLCHLYLGPRAPLWWYLCHKANLSAPHTLRFLRGAEHSWPELPNWRLDNLHGSLKCWCALLGYTLTTVRIVTDAPALLLFWTGNLSIPTIGRNAYQACTYGLQVANPARLVQGKRLSIANGQE